MRVAIFETDHYESAYPVIRFFDNGANTIFIYTIPSSYAQFRYLLDDDLPRYTWIIKDEEQSFRSYLKIVQQSLVANKIELLFLNTVSGNFILYARMIKRLPKLRVILTLHGLNSYFHFAPSLSIRRIGRYFGKRLLLKQINEFNVIAECLRPALTQLLQLNKKIYSIGLLNERKHDIPEFNQQVNLVIPGSVDGRRRNYSQVVDLLSLLQHTDLSLNITLLGPVYKDVDQKVINLLDRFLHSTIRIHHYEKEIIDAKEYERVMQQASIVWIPSVSTTIIEDGVKETYGETICSGNFFDIVKYAKPFIAPSGLNMDDALKKTCFHYNKVEQIAELLIHLKQDQLNEWNQRIQRTVDYYSLKSLRERHRSLLAIS